MRRVKLVAVGWLVVGVPLSLVVFRSAAVASKSLPDASTALAEFKRMSPSGAALKSEEADPASLAALKHVLVPSSGKMLLLQVGRTVNRNGEPRAVFTIFEVDPDTNQWRPVSSLDGAVKVSGITAEVLYLPDDTPYVGWLGGTSGRDVVYTSVTGTRQVLGTGAAGFAPLPADADPNQLMVEAR